MVMIVGPNVFERGGGSSQTTNNEMELTGLMAALQELVRLDFSGKVEVYLDSKYVLSGASRWIYSWAKSGWRTKDGSDVKNIDLWKKVYQFMGGLKNKVRFHWKYVPGHQGFPGNERADQIAVSYSKENPEELYEGPLDSYPLSVLNRLSEIEDFQYQSFSQPKKSNQAPVYYLSYVGGQVYRDKTWAQCSARVKNVSGAKYKKIKSSVEEEQTLQSWGVKI